MTSADTFEQSLAAAELAPPSRPELTILVPTFNEADNVDELVARLADAIPPTIRWTVLFVDDSTDDTPAAVRQMAQKSSRPLAVIHRDVPTGGLSGAVVEGLRMVNSVWVVVMDGDLQHPPELVPALIAEGRRTCADLVVASRNLPGGSRDGLAGTYRRVVSRSSTSLARLMFPKRLAELTDPMSGFFAIRREVIDVEVLRPVGFKILLELVVRSRISQSTELPFRFDERRAGASKSSVREGVRFLRHLAALRFGDSRFMRTIAFGAVGLSGFLPNLMTLSLLVQMGMHYTVASVISTQVAIIWNFLLLDIFVFTRSRRFSLGKRFSSFAIMNNLDLTLRIPALAFLIEIMHVGLLTATVITLVLAFSLRFFITDRFVYLTKRHEVDSPTGN